MGKSKSDSGKDRKEKEEDKEAGDSSSEDEYVVEKIVGRRIKGGRVSAHNLKHIFEIYKQNNINNDNNEFFTQVEYFLKWKGFPHSENSWEPIDNLGCPELIEAFEVNRQKELKEREGGPSSEEKVRQFYLFFFVSIDLEIALHISMGFINIFPNTIMIIHLHCKTYLNVAILNFSF